MNSERHTDNYYRSSYIRKARRRRIIRNRVLLLAAILLAVSFCVVVILLIIKNNRIADLYDTENRYSSLMNVDSAADSLVPYAVDLAVLTESPDDADYTPEHGLLVSGAEGYTVFNKNASSKLDPASTTKIMTAIIALKYGSLYDEVTVTEDAMVSEYGASLANLKPGQKLSLEQLLYGLMLPSGNDAANAIAIHIAGSVEAFADMMNAEAASLAAVDTHFTNPHGMTEDGHYTTAYDLYLMMNEALKYPEFRKICGTKQYIAEFLDADGLAVSRTWENTNGYINGDEMPPEGISIIGGKTGTTMAAGRCLVLASEDSSGTERISIVMNAGSRDELYAAMNRLLAKTD